MLISYDILYDLSIASGFKADLYHFSIYIIVIVSNPYDSIFLPSPILKL